MTRDLLQRSLFRRFHNSVFLRSFSFLHAGTQTSTTSLLALVRVSFLDIVKLFVIVLAFLHHKALVSKERMIESHPEYLELLR